MIELKKNPKLMKKLDFCMSSPLIDKQMDFVTGILTNSSVKKYLGEYAAKCKRQIEMGTLGKKNITKETSIRLEGNSFFVKKEYAVEQEQVDRAFQFK